MPCRTGPLARGPCHRRAGLRLPEVQPAFILVVPLAAQLERVGRLGIVAESPRVEVVLLDATRLLATVAVRRGVLAAAPVSFPEDAPDGRGRPSRAPVPGPARPRLVGPGALLAGELVEQDGEGAVEDGVVVSRRHRVPEQVLRTAQLLERLAADRELELVPLRGERRQDRGLRRRSRLDRRRDRRATPEAAAAAGRCPTIRPSAAAARPRTPESERWTSARPAAGAAGRRSPRSRAWSSSGWTAGRSDGCPP